MALRASHEDGTISNAILIPFSCRREKRSWSGQESFYYVEVLEKLKMYPPKWPLFSFLGSVQHAVLLKTWRSLQPLNDLVTKLLPKMRLRRKVHA